MSGNSDAPGPSFEDRLREARQRQGLDEVSTAKAAADSSGLGIGLRAGMELVAAEAVACAIGYGLDRLLHTLPLFLIVFVLLGGAAGILNVWRQFAPAPQKPGDTRRGG